MGVTKQRSATGNVLLPAFRPPSDNGIRSVPSYSLLVWTLGRGSVVWRIWPAVLIHTTFAVAVVTMSMLKIVNLQIPSVMLTVLGVVIGFVISYRASSGYERYWLGRTCWSDIIRNSRTLSRLIWFHVPPRLTPKTAHEIQTGQMERSREELNKVMAEKLVALGLVEGFAVALKHHMRGELGIYYEDLYHCVRPMHEHDHNTNDPKSTKTILATVLPSPRRAQQITKETIILSSPSHILVDVEDGTSAAGTYGTFDPTSNASSVAASHSAIHNLLHRQSRSSVVSSASTHSQHHQLLPSSQPPPQAQGNIMGKVSEDIIPFAGVISSLKRRMHPPVPVTAIPSPKHEVHENSTTAQAKRRWQGPILSTRHSKHRPKVAGGGENLPLEILRCLSEWCSTLEDRGTVPGSSMGPMIASVAGFEESLTALERILTTPLPFVYSVHISTVWIYLFFLPFQLVNQFGYYAIPGVAIASFIYLGFIAAGEEIEQPFGYDENDLDLDLFCRDIIHADIQQIKASPCLNAYFDSDPSLQATGMGITPRQAFAVSQVSNLPQNYD